MGGSNPASPDNMPRPPAPSSRIGITAREFVDALASLHGATRQCEWCGVQVPSHKTECPNCGGMRQERGGG